MGETRPMNALGLRMKRMIEADGPISVATFMALCLADPDHGYYTSRPADTVFGALGDFITAPEISQLFGEMIAVNLVMALDALASDAPVILAELGPGRGVLMRDMLRSIRRLRPARIVQPVFVEISPHLRKVQSTALAGLAAPMFCNSVAELPSTGPLLIVGNEFLDALPIRQFEKSGQTWHERMLTWKDGEFVFTLHENGLPEASMPHLAQGAPEGSIVEIAPARIAVVEEMAHRLATQSGLALLIDYGATTSGTGDTLQAMRDHAFAAVLAAPGEADLTSHVDFEPLAKAAVQAGCQTAITTQSAFLLQSGLLQRAGRLGAGKSSVEQRMIETAVERLAAPEAMGELFKVLGIAYGVPLPATLGRVA
jgi:NADH dehydrogenase [ubiquinone] 1 alpha subcomplex assembly factor 7